MGRLRSWAKEKKRCSPWGPLLSHSACDVRPQNTRKGNKYPDRQDMTVGMRKTPLPPGHCSLSAEATSVGIFSKLFRKPASLDGEEKIASSRYGRRHIFRRRSATKQSMSAPRCRALSNKTLKQMTYLPTYEPNRVGYMRAPTIIATLSSEKFHHEFTRKFPPTTVGEIVEITVGAIVCTIVGNGFAIKLTRIHFLRCKLATTLQNKK